MTQTTTWPCIASFIIGMIVMASIYGYAHADVYLPRDTNFSLGRNDKCSEPEKPKLVWGMHPVYECSGHVIPGEEQ